jgi:RNA polymerase sigma-70 factor (ECF subfamily)
MVVPSRSTPHLQPEDATDSALFAALARGESAALGPVYDRYQRLVFSLAYALLSSRETAEEVTQETFLAVWQRAALYQPARGTPRTWLLSIAHHRAVDALRRQQARPSTVPWPDADNHAGSFDTWSVVSQALTAEELHALVATLSPLQGESVALAFFDDYRYAEIAVRLGIPLSTAKSRLRQGLAQLRRQWVTPASGDTSPDRHSRADLPPARVEVGHHTGQSSALRRHTSR